MKCLIYEPAEDSYLLAEQVKKYAFGKVLDMGTGSGIQSAVACSSKKVKSVLAVDVNEDALMCVDKHVKKNKIRKIKTKKSNLFSNIKDKFDTIIFNPPYLPLDKSEPQDSRLATTGGKHGYEVLQKFMIDLNDHLTEEGFALILFSSLTNKEKVEEIIKEIGYEFKELSNQKISFETLYVYQLRRNNLINELFDKKVSRIQKFAEGFRGIIYSGRYKNKKIAIKVQRDDVNTETVNKESKIIQKINKRGIGPKFLFSGNNYFVYEFVEGELIENYLKKQDGNGKYIFLNVLKQCRILDKLKISKEEMTNPYKHIIIGKKIVLIDFERAHYDSEPQNVTQFCQYLMNFYGKTELISLAKEYKHNQSEKNYLKIRTLLSAKSKSS